MLSVSSFLFLTRFNSVGASLYFYFISDRKQAFNNMFCRIWQFLFGKYFLCQEYNSCRQHGLLFGEVQPGTQVGKDASPLRRGAGERRKDRTRLFGLDICFALFGPADLLNCNGTTFDRKLLTVRAKRSKVNAFYPL